MHFHSTESGNKDKKKERSGRWGKKHTDNSNWKEYNGELVIRGMMIFDMDFTGLWNNELKTMNRGKRGSPYLFPKSFMNLMIIWHQYLDYRGLEGMARSLIEMGIIPCYGDYTTIWHRIQDMKPDLGISGMEHMEIGSDGTGMKTNNSGSYRITKYGDPDARRRKHLIVIITADVRTKKIMGIESHVEGSGSSEPETAMKHIGNIVLSGSSIDSFYGDGAYDTNDLFSLIHQVGAIPVIKIRKNASPDRIKGSKYRRRAIREYQEKGYRTWSEDNEYGMRWPGTEGIFSAVKREFGENCTSLSVRGLEVKGCQRLWVFDHINQGAMMRVKSMS